MTMYLDASPFGLGGMLTENDELVSWFGTPLSHHDSTIHRRAIGDSDGQQVWEALVVLVATRCWPSRWVGRKTTITAKSDNMAALSMFASLKSKVSSLTRREVAFETCKSSFQPRFVEHIPGVFNFSPDGLSRRWDPHYAPAHVKLPGSLEISVPTRDWSYYRTLPVQRG